MPGSFNFRSWQRRPRDPHSVSVDQEPSVRERDAAVRQRTVRRAAAEAAAPASPAIPVRSPKTGAGTVLALTALMGRFFAQDLRRGFRNLTKSLGFSAAAIVVLALGIGANTAIFSVVDSVLLQPLPYPDPGRLVRIWHTPPQSSFPGLRTFSVSPANFLDWERDARSFECVAFYRFIQLNLTGGASPEALTAARVTGDFFNVLRAAPLLGRTFNAEESRPGAGPTAVLGHALWKTRFGGDPSIVGRDIHLNGMLYRVVGVMGPEVRLPDYAQLWVPYEWTPEQRATRANHNGLVIGRLKPGVDRSAAQAEMSVISDRLARQYPEEDAGWGAVVVPLREDLVADVRPVLLVLLGSVAFVLLIACANIANLVLARTLGRRRELALRSALGASRARLIQQLLSETLLLALAGGALGLFLAHFGVDAIVAFLAEELPRSAEVALDARVLSFTFVLAVAIGVLAGIVPAWRLTRGDVAGPLRQGAGRTVGEGDPGARTRGLLVVSEVALSLVLLVGAGLMVRSLWLLQRVDPGFDAKNVVTMHLALPNTKYAEPVRAHAFLTELLERFGSLPGVEAAGGVSDLPLTGAQNWPIAIEGRPVPPIAQQPTVVGSVVAGDYFRALRIRLVDGRLFNAADSAGSPAVVLVSESMAKRFWPGENALHKRLSTSLYPGPREVVGIVADVKLNGLELREPDSAMYLPESQFPLRAIDLAIRTANPGSAAAAVVAVHALDPDLPVLRLGSLEAIRADSISRQRFGMVLLAGFAGLALVLAAVGISSVLAYSVRRRRREIGIRIALGARTSDVLRMVIVQGLRPAILGMVIGVAGALALARVLSSLIFGIRATDPATFAAVALLLGAVAVVACLVPARRAAAVSPTTALRDD
jgi:predicted permease